MDGEKPDVSPALHQLPSAASVDVIIVGQGLAGSTLGWQLHWNGWRIAFIDRGVTTTASHVAAGLITPITGKRMVMMADFPQYWKTAETFYRRVESETGRPLLSVAPMVRWFRNRDEEELFHQHRQQQYAETLTLTPQNSGVATGFQMQPAGRLAVSDFLTATRSFFTRQHVYRVADVNPGTDLSFSGDQITLPRLQLTGRLIVFAQGYQVTRPPWYPQIPNKPARGDILHVRLPERTEQRITHQGIWIAPEAAGTYRIGATYDWNDLSIQPSATGREQLLSQLPKEEKAGLEVLEHAAAVRPAMKDRRVVAEIHPQERRVAILNGLGAKGSLVAPSKAEKLAAEISEELMNRANMDPEEVHSTFAANVADIAANVADREHSRNTLDGLFRAKSVPQGRQSLTRLVHQLLAEHLQEGDLAIDATAGQGFDTLFLAKQTGPTGHVWAFDIQQQAIQQTQQRLALEQVTHVTLYHASHEDLECCEENNGRISAVTFNLGYLPGSDKTVVTQVNSTLKAIQASYRLLRIRGLMTIVAYRGHEGGSAEYQAVEDLLQSSRDRAETPEKARSLTAKGNHRIQRIEADPTNACSPVLWVIQKLSDGGTIGQDAAYSAV